MSWGAIIGGAAALIGGAISSNAAGDAADSQRAGYDAATQEQARQFDTTQQNLQPFLQFGQQALTNLTAANNGDFSAFEKSPDYAWAFDQGTKALNRGAIGNLSGGGTAADLVSFGQGLANQRYDTWANRQAAYAGLGQTTANNLGAYGQSFANQVGQNAIGSGNAQASAYQNQANAWNGALQGVTGAVGYGYANNGYKWGS